MSITTEGKNMIKSLDTYAKDIMGISELEERLKNKLDISKVIIAPGDCDEDEIVKKDMARYAGRYAVSVIKDNSTVGITGGSSMYQFANEFKAHQMRESVLVVPARGGIGSEVETQSNNVAAMLGKKLGCEYKLLHVPDNIGKDTLKTLTLEPNINKTLQYMKNIDVLIFGVGRADEMAKRRKMDINEICDIDKKHAVGEAFGYYFDKNGNIVYETNTAGIELSSVEKIENIIAVSGGSKKADAICAITKINKNIVLITDEGCANKILGNN